MNDLQTPSEAETKPCMLCKLPPREELVNHRYCQRCHQQLEQAYNWLQSSLVPEDEMKELHNIMLDLTDISKLELN